MELNLQQGQELRDALGLDSLTLEDQEKLLLDLNELIVRNSMVRILEEMSEDAREKFSHVVESGSEEDIERFITAEVPRSDRLVAEAAQELIGDILAVTNRETI